MAELQQRERCGPALMRSDGEKIQIRRKKKGSRTFLTFAQEKKIRAIILRYNIDEHETPSDVLMLWERKNWY